MPPHSTIPATRPVLLYADSVCFGYPQRAVLTDWSTRVTAGVTLVRGGDGAGKSTLLRLLAGDLAPQGGQLRANGFAASASPAAYRQQVFWVNVRSDANDALTPGECFDALARRYPTFRARLIGDLLDGLSLTPHLQKRLFMLSAGSRRKVWLAAAFAAGAPVTLLDEPFAALDAPAIRFVTALLHEAAEDDARAWVVADYQPPAGVALSQTVDLGG
jgi:ABC-type multidrug transport system ATPase subunit